MTAKLNRLRRCRVPDSTVRLPFSSSSSHTELNHRRLGQGEPLLLLHGIGGELCVWEPVLEPLAERMDVIAVDLPGFGHSPPLPDGVTPTPMALAASVARLMDELDVGSAHLAGNSLGGWTSWARPTAPAPSRPYARLGCGALRSVELERLHEDAPTSSPSGFAPPSRLC